MNQHTLTMIAKKHNAKVIRDQADHQWHLELPNGELLTFSNKRLQECTSEHIEGLIRRAAEAR